MGRTLLALAPLRHRCPTLVTSVILPSALRGSRGYLQTPQPLPDSWNALSLPLSKELVKSHAPDRRS